MTKILPTEQLSRELWRRAARHFQAAGLLQNSAEAWQAAGAELEAARDLLKAEAWEHALPLLLEMKMYNEAARAADKWLQELDSCSRPSGEEKCCALLARATALQLNGQKDSARLSYQQARQILAAPETIDLGRARAWQALARYGRYCRRPDLYRLGYEKALAACGNIFQRQKQALAGDYLAFLDDDPLLAADINRRLKTWQSSSRPLQKAREQLSTALNDFLAETGK